MIARQIRNLPVDEAIKQMEFSDKRTAKKVLHNLAFARKNAADQKDMHNMIVGKLLFTGNKAKKKMGLRTCYSTGMGWKRYISKAYQHAWTWTIWCKGC